MNKPTPLQTLTAIMDTSRNGTDNYSRSPFNRAFLYTSGVREVADSIGAYWLLDIIATEVVVELLRRFKSTGDYFASLTITVKNDKADITATMDSGVPPWWSKHIDYTDFPEGEWKFFLMVDGLLQGDKTSVVMMLPSQN
jgi:hypothetical protein